MTGVGTLTSFSKTQTRPSRSHSYIWPVSSKVTPTAPSQKPPISVSTNPGGRVAACATLPSVQAISPRIKRMEYDIFFLNGSIRVLKISKTLVCTKKYRCEFIGDSRQYTGNDSPCLKKLRGRTPGLITVISNPHVLVNTI